MAGTVDKLGPAGDHVQPLFITVNPELDTPEQLKTYVALFHPRLIGLTGDRRQIRDVTHAFKVYFAKTAPAIGSDPNEVACLAAAVYTELGVTMTSTWSRTSSSASSRIRPVSPSAQRNSILRLPPRYSQAAAAPGGTPQGHQGMCLGSPTGSR
jgi:hypothetical protein